MLVNAHGGANASCAWARAWGPAHKQGKAAWRRMGGRTGGQMSARVARERARPNKHQSNAAEVSFPPPSWPLPSSPRSGRAIARSASARHARTTVPPNNLRTPGAPTNPGPSSVTMITLGIPWPGKNELINSLGQRGRGAGKVPTNCPPAQHVTRPPQCIHAKVLPNDTNSCPRAAELCCAAYLPLAMFQGGAQLSWQNVKSPCVADAVLNIFVPTRGPAHTPEGRVLR